MFSAIYLVCFIGQPCVTFVDSPTYTTVEECLKGAKDNVERNTVAIRDSGGTVPDVEYQCVSWNKA